MFKKLHVPQCARAHVIHPPKDCPGDGLTFQFHSQGAHFDFVHVFALDESTFTQGLAQAEKLSRKDGLLWVSYPKHDPHFGMTGDDIRQTARPLGLHPGARVSFGRPMADGKYAAVNTKHWRRASLSGVFIAPRSNSRFLLNCLQRIEYNG